MEQNDWLARRDAAQAAAHRATCVEACLALLHEAGVFSVRARACGIAAASD